VKTCESEDYPLNNQYYGSTPLRVSHITHKNVYSYLSVAINIAASIVFNDVKSGKTFALSFDSPQGRDSIM